MTIFDVGRAEMLVEQEMTIPMLRFLGCLIKGWPQHHAHMSTMRENKLWELGLIDIYDRKWGYRKWSVNEPTMLGREVYDIARKRWIERNISND